ncbi:TPA: helix-turn-helix transcriptional regulator [Candidatus Avigastranaerophilus faecigallinarum]|nr:helix-turn-helix transcriptional regulator [Candidatus Avigastranaerophilus faecigallinarum]
MSELKKLLGKRIREIRVARNLTQEDLSELTEIGASSISKIESGHFHPTDENLERIAKALNVEPYKLYMFNHQKDIDDLKQDIIKMLDKASDEDIKLAYKVLSGILD